MEPCTIIYVYLATGLSCSVLVLDEFSSESVKLTICCEVLRKETCPEIFFTVLCQQHAYLVNIHDFITLVFTVSSGWRFQ